MNSKKKNHIFRKRLLAYIIDLIILSVLISTILLIIKNDRTKINLIQSDISNLSELLLNKTISIKVYLKEYANLLYQYDKELIITNLLNIIGIIALYIIIPLFNNGQTIGKKICHYTIEKIDKTKISILDLTIRSIIINFLGYSLITTIAILLVKPIPYMIIVFIFGIIQFLLVIISGFMVLYNKDKRGIQDILTKTKIRVIK